MPNRLRLDFSINNTDERKKFIDQYISRPEFIKSPLTNDELETIANYILWGKDSDGLNCTQRGEIQIETRNKTWQRDDTESLDALMESPTFNEASVRQLEIRPKISREIFDRKKALSECPAHLRPVFSNLFEQIDTIELGINYYDLAHDKRKEEPRQSLLRRFSELKRAQIQQAAEKWSQARYLKMRHLIVELRREQFTLRDTYIAKIARHSYSEPEVEPQKNEFDAEIPVYPLGLINSPCAPLIFPQNQTLAPSTFSQDQLKQISYFYWQKKQGQKTNLFFDFACADHLYRLINFLQELQDSQSEDSYSNTKPFLDTLRYYINMADLTNIQRDILDMKIQKKRNQDIAKEISQKYNKSYMVNYISTIFTQRIIPRIIAAVNLHSAIVENLSFKENFKKCNTCGKELFISSENFVRKSRSKDGFSNRCKKCDKLDREKKNEVIK